MKNNAIMICWCGWELKWRKSVEIEEWKNPEFFQEMLEKYLPQNENKDENNRPF